MWTRSLDETADADGLNAIEAEFYTEHFVIQGALTSPELRLSDHLNSSTAMFELRPLLVQRSLTGLRINVAGSSAYITKAHLLFVLPAREGPPPPESGDCVWSETTTHTCWAGIGRYSLVGKVHMEAGRNPRLFLRSLEQRQFIPFTDAHLTLPDGSTRDVAAVIVNRHQLELLSVENDSQ